MSVRAIGVLAALAFSMGLGGPVQAYPFWSSDQVRQLRPTAVVETLVFDVRAEAIAPGRPTQVNQSTVSLAPTYDHVATGQDQVVGDYRLCRVLRWRTGGSTVQTDNCYVSPVFRVFELQNRMMLGKVLAKAGKGEPDPYWDEASLGVQLVPTPRLTARRSGDTTEYRLGDTVVVKLSGAAGTLSATEKQSVTRYLARYAALHPQVRREIVSSGVLPAVIESQTSTLGVSSERRVVTISNLRRVQAAYPLPAGLASALRTEAAKGATARDAAVREALLVIDGVSPRRRPTLKALTEGIVTAVNATNAMMLFMNMTQQYGMALRPGPESKAVLTEIGPSIQLARQDPVVAQFWSASSLAGDPRAPGDRQAAARFLVSAKQMDQAPFGTFRGVTYANLVRISRDARQWDPATRAGMPAQLVDNYWIHIAAYPWASSTYKDAGATYASQFDFQSAYLAYDLGRAVDPDWRTGAMSELALLESKVREGEPDFF